VQAGVPESNIPAPGLPPSPLEPPLRYEVTDRVLQLALAMQGSRMGLTLAEIERDFDVRRRTAQRMRDAV
jgi:hypothetical protein